MKVFRNLTMMLLALSSIALVSCGDDDDNTTGNEVSYDLFERSDSDVSGTIEFKELEDGSVQAEISLEGTSDGNSHPAHIHMNSAAMGGDILVSLDPVDGATGSSVTLIDRTDAGGDFTFSMIENIDAYVNVHLSASELGTIVAQGDIGSNLLTGDTKTYDLDERAVDGISGMVKFSKRKNGYTLAEINLDNTPEGGEHPAHIHMNSFVEGGSIVVSLNPVNGTTGSSMTDIRTTDAGEDYDYEQVITDNTYVNVHLSANDLGTIVAQGDIGSNELTGTSKTYDLDELADSGVSGEVKFEERLDGSVLATISLDGTPEGGMHPAHIHENSVAEGGPIAISFTAVDGTSGMSQTSIRTLDDGSPVTYSQLDIFNGYVNIHLSMDQLGIVVAQGNIGINAD